MEHDWLSAPLVSAVMIAGDHERFEYAQRAVDCFNAQSWKLKELILFNGTGMSFKGVKGHRVYALSSSWPGDLKNVGMESARGEWVFPWGDDCWYHGEYIEQHMLAARASIPTILDEAEARFVKSQSAAILRNDDQLVFCSFFRRTSFRYGPDGSDLPFLHQFESWQRIPSLHGVALAARFFIEE